MIKNSKYLVLTPSGYQPFSGIQEINKDVILQITFVNGTRLTCSINHTFVVDGVEILASSVKSGDFLYSSKDKIKVIDIKELSIPSKLYDLVNVSNGNVYFTNDILSHNCDVDFSTSGNTVIGIDHLDFYTSTYVKDPIEKRGIDGNYWIWESCNYNDTYIVSADVARGDGTDYSAAHVIKVSNMEQVAEYKGQIGTSDFGNMLVAIATEYNDALLVIENANIGWAAIQPAIDRNYKNLYYSQKADDNIMNPLKYLRKGFDLIDINDKVAGFTTQSKNRPMMIGKEETYIRDREVIIHSKRTIDELRVFIWKHGKAQAQSGYNDDLVMALAIGLWVRDTAVQLKQAGIDLNRKMLDSFTRIGITTGKDIKKPAIDPWKMKTGNGTDEDITWLIS